MTGQLDFLVQRRSIRRFQPEAVPMPVMRRLLQAAGRAPSAHNRQYWRFVVITSSPVKTRLVEAMAVEFRHDLLADGLTSEQVEYRIERARQRLLGAPVIVLLCLDPTQGDTYPDAHRQELEMLMGVQSVAMAGENLLLAAHAEGLGSVWMCAPLFAPERVCQVLALPPHWRPQGLVLLGYPAEMPELQPRKPIEELTLFL
jgi:F420 biosynthesis protein FbiB-like protein